MIKEGQYFPILFTIPFWIFEIYIFRKSILGIKDHCKKNKQKINVKGKAVTTYFLVGCVFLSGIICLIVGIKDSYYTSRKTKNYVTTTCYFKDYEIYDSNEKDHHDRVENTTYRLIYVYEVDGIKYSIKTDYGSGFLPDVNSSRKIKYNPNDPSVAVFVGTNRNRGLIYFGVFFLLGGTLFVLGILHVNGAFDKTKVDVLGICVGFVFFIVGIGIIAFQMGEGSSFIETMKRMGFWFLIPILFIIVGCFQMIKCIFFERLETNYSNKKKK